jgi:hypothetical protein
VIRGGAGEGWGAQGWGGRNRGSGETGPDRPKLGVWCSLRGVGFLFHGTPPGPVSPRP